MTTPLRLGIDLGQSNDSTALAAFHCIRDYEIRQLGRLPLGTSYPDVAKTIVTTVYKMRHLDAQAKAAKAKPGELPEPASEISVYVDFTGIGRAVVDLLREPLQKAEAHLVPVLITAGDEMKEVVTDDRASGLYRYVKVGKQYLVGRLQALLQTRRVIGAPSAEFTEAQKQLMTFQRTTNKNMYDQFNAKSGEHDDLVIALALGCLDEIPTDANELAELNARIPGRDAPIKTYGGSLGEGFESTGGRQTFGWTW